MSSTEFLRRTIRERDLPGMRSALQGGAPVNYKFPPSRQGEAAAMTAIMLVLDDLVSGTESTFIEGWKSRPLEVFKVLVAHGAELTTREVDVLRTRLKSRFERLCGLSTPACQKMHKEFDLRLQVAISDEVQPLIAQRTLLGHEPPPRKGPPLGPTSL